MTRRRDAGPSRSRTATAVAAVVWAVGFALLHVAWAAGSRLFIGDVAAADAAFDRSWFRLYNAAVVAGSLAAAGLVIASMRARRRGSRRWMQRLLWLPAGVLTLRGSIGAAQLVVAAVTGDVGPPVGAWSMDLLMLLGGVTFAVHARASS